MWVTLRSTGKQVKKVYEYESCPGARVAFLTCLQMTGVK